MNDRKLILCLITSTDFLRQVHSVWDMEYLESVTARRIARWCWEYFDRYDKAPLFDIESIFKEKTKTDKLPEAIQEEIEDFILPYIKENIANPFNLSYNLDETLKYFLHRSLEIHKEHLETLLDQNKDIEAETLCTHFKTPSLGADDSIDLNTELATERIEKAFLTSNESLITYPGAMGEFVNNQFTRGALVGLMSSEKRGKSYCLLDFAVRSCQQGRSVIFFQAGDMTADQQLLRFAIYISGKSNLRKYCGEMHEAVADCKRNQLHNCDKCERKALFEKNDLTLCGPFDGCDEQNLYEKSMTKEKLLEVFNDYNDKYIPCTDCDDYILIHLGAPWLRFIEATRPLSMREARLHHEEFLEQNNGKFKLSTHANGSLSVKQIKSLMSNWEKQSGFVADVVVIDYADLLSSEVKIEFRHQQNEIWKALRNLSQEKHCLVITATQADAKSYEAERLKYKNFSEDKRKYAHVTAMFGLNQDPDDREKKIGIMRINEIVIREGEFSNKNEVVVLQNLRRGKPFISSYFSK